MILSEHTLKSKMVTNSTTTSNLELIYHAKLSSCTLCISFRHLSAVVACRFVRLLKFVVVLQDQQKRNLEAATNAQLQRRQKKIELVKSIVNSDTDSVQTDGAAPTPSAVRARSRLGSANTSNAPWRPGGVNPARSEPDLATRSKTGVSVPRTPSGSSHMNRSRAPFGTGYTPSSALRTARRGRSPPPTKPVSSNHSNVIIAP